MSAAHVRGAFFDGTRSCDHKPGNIIVCERGGAQDVVKLLDFGLVHVQAELSGASPEAAEKKAEPVAAVRAQSAGAGQGDAARLTLAGQLLGTPAYMSPEQVRQQQPDTRSDIYSLGGLLYFLLTGGPPFERDTLEQLFAAHLSAVAPSVREREPAISEALDAIIARCLEKDPARRFQHVRELLAALAATKEAGEWDSDRAEAWWRQQQGIGGGQTETSIKPVSEVVPDELAMTMKSI